MRCDTSTQIAEFYAKISADVSGLQKGLADASKGLETVAKQSKSSGGAFQSLTGQLAGMVNPANLAMAAVTGLGVYLVKSTKAAAESAQIDAKLAAVLRATGGAAGLTAQDIDEMSTSLSKMSGVDDEAVKSGAAVLATFREIGGSVFPQAMQAALDMSAVMGQDLQSSIVQIGKALNEPIAGVGALRRVGVQLTDQQQDQIKAFMASGDVMSAQGVILQELQAEFGGAAQAMNAAGDGSANLQVAFGNLSEAIGGALLPAVRDGNKGLTSFIDQMAQSFTDSQEFGESLDQNGESLINLAHDIQNATKGHQNYQSAQAGTYQETMSWNDAMLEAQARLAALDQNRAIADLRDDYGGMTAAAAEANAQIGMTDEQIKAVSDANKSFLSTVMDVSKAQEEYASGVADVREQFQDAKYVQDLYYERLQTLYDSYRAGRITAQEYNDAVKNTQAAYKDGSFAANEQQQAIAGLQAQYDKSTKQIVADLILMQMTADGSFDSSELSNYLTILANFGLITRDAAEAARDLAAGAQGQADAVAYASEKQAVLAAEYATTGDAATSAGSAINPLVTNITRVTGQAAKTGPAIDAVNDAMENMAEQGAKDAAGATHDVAMALNQLNGSSASMYIDIWVREHGKVPTSLGGTQSHGSSIQAGTGEVGRAYGGELNKEGLTVVGEGPGGWSPTAEIVIGNQVIPHRVAQQWKDAGLLDNVRRAYFGTQDGFSGGEAAVYLQTQRAAAKKRAGSSVTAVTVKGSSSDVSAGIAVPHAALADVSPSPGIHANASLDTMMVNKTQEGNGLLDEMNKTLDLILAKLPSATDNAKAARVANSRYS